MDRMSLRASRQAPLVCLNALRTLAHARICDLAAVTGYDRRTVREAMHALLALGLARREGALGQFWPAADPAGVTAGAGNMVENLDFSARGSSSSYINSSLDGLESKRTTTTTTPSDAAKCGMDAAKSPTSGKQSPTSGKQPPTFGRKSPTFGRKSPTSATDPRIADVAEEPRLAGDEAKRILAGTAAGGPAPQGPAEEPRRAGLGGMPPLPPDARRIAAILVERTDCPPVRALAAVVEALRGAHPAYVELEVLKWSACAARARGRTVQSQGAVAANRIAHGVPAPEPAAPSEWDDRARVRRLKAKLEDLQRAARAAAEASGASGDRSGEKGGDAGDGQERAAAGP